MIKRILSYLNNRIPKEERIIFTSFPSYSDNSYALYRYIMANRPDICRKYEILWAQDTPERIPEDVDTHKVFEKKSLRGIMLFLKARYVISTHGYFSGIRSGNGQLQLNLWHGCGFKDIPEEEQVYRGDITISSGEFYRKIQAKALKMPLDSVIPTGLPRTDELFDENDALFRLGIDENKYKKIIIWLPTYRSGTDGREDSFGVKTISTDEYKKLNDLLDQKGYLLIVKLHPLDSEPEEFDSFDNVFFLKTHMMMEREVQLCQLLSKTDILLSDYSSVIVDYLMLDKPVAMVFSDLKEYENNRGFVFENIEDYMVGEKISGFDQLYDYFENCDAVNEKWKIRRRELTNLFNDYFDGQSSKRVCDLIFGEYNEA